MLTVLMHGPEDDSHPELGTTIYKVSPMGAFHGKSYGLVKVKTAAFAPNTGFAFVVIHPAHNLLDTELARPRQEPAFRSTMPRPRMTILNTPRKAAEGRRGRERVSG